MGYLQVSRKFKRTSKNIKFARKVNVYFYRGKNLVGIGHALSLQECYTNAKRTNDADYNHASYLQYYDHFQIHNGWEPGLFIGEQPEVTDPVQDKIDYEKNMVFP